MAAQELIVAIDADNSTLGPAYYFHSTFDAIAVVPSSTGSKRAVSMQKQQTQVPVGDQPLFCLWNSTLIEGFIFPVEGVIFPGVPAAGSYPQLIKLQLRWVADSTVTPYCQEMQILDDGTAGLVTDSSGQAIQSTLNVTENPSSDCSCTWWNGD